MQSCPFKHIGQDTMIILYIITVCNNVTTYEFKIMQTPFIMIEIQFSIQATKHMKLLAFPMKFILTTHCSNNWFTWNDTIIPLSVTQCNSLYINIWNSVNCCVYSTLLYVCICHIWDKKYDYVIAISPTLQKNIITLELFISHKFKVLPEWNETEKEPERGNETQEDKDERKVSRAWMSCSEEQTVCC